MYLSRNENSSEIIGGWKEKRGSLKSNYERENDEKWIIVTFNSKFNRINEVNSVWKLIIRILEDK